MELGGIMAEYVVTGSTGLLGRAFMQRLGSSHAVTIQRARLDADQPDAVLDAILEANPRRIINCAAHTDLEAAERDPRLDEKVNSRLPAILAEAARRCDAVLVHFSSTGCYGDWKETPYSESDETRPTTAHHRAKIAGEDAVRRSGAHHIILRTGWLYGGAPGQSKNFVWRRLLEARSTKRMTSDASQRGCPTFVDDLVGQTLAVIEAGEEGVFNATAHGGPSRYEYVKEIVAVSGLDCEVEPGAAFARLAPVSPNETAVNARLQRLGLDYMRSWNIALAPYVNSLMNSAEWRSSD